MSEEKAKPVKFELDYFINSFSKPLTIAFVISLVSLILICLHRPSDTVMSDNDYFISNSEAKVSKCLTIVLIMCINIHFVSEKLAHKNRLLLQPNGKLVKISLQTH